MRKTREFRGVLLLELADVARTGLARMESFENGSERIPAACLIAIAEYLGVAPSFFFDGLPGLRQKPGGDIRLPPARAAARCLYGFEESAFDEYAAFGPAFH